MTGLADDQAIALRRLLETGLPLCSRPYRQMAQQIGATEQAVMEQVQAWNQDGLFRRVGLVLNHRALGYRANAMLVLDVPDEQVEQVGRRLGAEPGINLCYQRARCLPRWRYNLFCMLHGHRREQVEQAVDRLLVAQGLSELPHELLFSVRAFKQCGGRYAAAPTESTRG